ncbi:hypothetical protein CEXT_279201 [Caerostris extrusa]|uniref:Uncharacterized protein n=1 Tax=Caerostris extrusa TaxID=172846 RepID=A0AAV4VCP4_CAEEX|nr:hypothetical protein CEXT_279201 [Caerostris extrusa]
MEDHSHLVIPQFETQAHFLQRNGIHSAAIALVVCVSGKGYNVGGGMGGLGGGVGDMGGLGGGMGGMGGLGGGMGGAGYGLGGGMGGAGHGLGGGMGGAGYGLGGGMGGVGYGLGGGMGGAGYGGMGGGSFYTQWYFFQPKPFSMGFQAAGEGSTSFRDGGVHGRPGRVPGRRQDQRTRVDGKENPADVTMDVQKPPAGVQERYTRPAGTGGRGGYGAGGMRGGLGGAGRMGSGMGGGYGGMGGGLGGAGGMGSGMGGAGGMGGGYGGMGRGLGGAGGMRGGLGGSGGMGGGLEALEEWEEDLEELEE